MSKVFLRCGFLGAKEPPAGLHGEAMAPSMHAPQLIYWQAAGIRAVAQGGSAWGSLNASENEHHLTRPRPLGPAYLSNPRRTT